MSSKTWKHGASTQCPLFFIDETRSELVAGKVLFRELPALNRVQCDEGDDQTDRCLMLGYFMQFCQSV